LVAHLRADVVLLGEHAHLPRFPHRVAERLLAVDVLAHPDGLDAGRGVHVVGRADGYRVDLVAELLEHLAVVVERLGLGEALLLLGERMVVDVAESDDGAEVAGLIDVAGALAADADAGELQLAVGLVGSAGGGERGAGEPVAWPGESRGLQKVAAVESTPCQETSKMGERGGATRGGRPGRRWGDGGEGKTQGSLQRSKE